MNNFNLKAAIFDLDGTLLNTLEDLADSINYSLAKNGFQTHELSKFPYFVGEGIVKLVSRTLPEEKRSDVTIKNILKDLQEHYGGNWANKTKPYDGIIELVEYLRNNKVKLAVLSNKPHDFAVIMTNFFFKKDDFELIYGESKLHPTKPDPSLANTIANHFGIDKTSCVFIGDTNIDILTAKAAGMFSVGAGWGFRGKDELIDFGADVVFNSPFELLEFFKKIKK